MTIDKRIKAFDFKWNRECKSRMKVDIKLSFNFKDEQDINHIKHIASSAYQVISQGQTSSKAHKFITGITTTFIVSKNSQKKEEQEHKFTENFWKENIHRILFVEMQSTVEVFKNFKFYYTHTRVI